MADFDPEAYACQAALAVGLALRPHHMAGVTLNLALAARMAAVVNQMPLAPADEAAPVFIPARIPPK